MPMKRDVRMGGARFGKIPASVRPPTSQQIREQIENMLRLALRRYAIRNGVPSRDINTKVNRLLARFRRDVRDELGTGV